MCSKTGKIIFRYVGHHGRHTEVYQDDELIAASFNCDKSIALLIWCIADRDKLPVNLILNKQDWTYEETELGKKICKNFFNRFNKSISG